jgi:hypothetical protein
MTLRVSLIGTAAVVLAASLTAGCANYDYLQRTDRISYRAGNAVHANLERETLNPSSDSMYDTSGLGKNGSVLPADPTSSSSAQPPATPPTNSP